MAQYIFSLPFPPRFGADNFIVSPCNHDAWQWIHAWPKWPGTALILHGPSGSGKSHLGHIWAARARAAVVAATSLSAVDPGKGNWLIEDIETISDPRSLLHFFNASRENGGQMLLTSNVPANQLPFTLADLTSRLIALPSAHIDQPDDDALLGSMRKQFTDRQMKVDEEVIAYIVPRVERSFAKIQELVERLDKAALSTHKNITIPFVRNHI